MTIKQCDICQKRLTTDAVSIRHGFEMFELCVSCAQPIKKLLKKHGLLVKSAWKDLSTNPEAV